MIPNPTDIENFIEVANCKNLSRAAERLGVSQPSVSISLKRLEDNIGEALLLRSKKGVELTKAGQQLLKSSKILLSTWDDIKNSAASSMNEVNGKIKLGCHPSVGLYTLKHFLPNLTKKNKKLSFDIHHDLSRKITEEVISLKLDIGIVVNPVKHPDLIITPICRDEVKVWKSSKTKNEDILICDSNLIQSQDIIKKLKKSKVNYERLITSSSLENITQLVSEGAGLGIIPSRVVNNLGVKNIKPINNAPIFKDEIALIYRVENKNLASIKAIVKEIKASLTS